MQSRFWKKVNKLTTDKCWIWRGATQYKGYGVIGRGGRGMGNESAHRYSYMIHVGEIPKGMCVCHRCDTPACVNPFHLFLGTNADNSSDMVRKGRHYMTVDPSRIRRGFKMKPSAIQRGSQQSAAKLSEGDIPIIRKLNLPQREIASIYGVDQALIQRIRSRKSWAHIP